MDPIEFCEMKHGYCACKKAGEVHCEQILRLVEDPVEIRKAQEKRDAAERKRRSRYIEDDPPPRYRMMGSEMLVPRISYEFPKTASQVAISKHSRHDSLFSVDFSKIEARVLKHLKLE